MKEIIFINLEHCLRVKVKKALHYIFFAKLSVTPQSIPEKRVLHLGPQRLSLVHTVTSYTARAGHSWVLPTTMLSSCFRSVVPTNSKLGIFSKLNSDTKTNWNFNSAPWTRKKLLQVTLIGCSSLVLTLQSIRRRHPTSPNDQKTPLPQCLTSPRPLGTHLPQQQTTIYYSGQHHLLPLKHQQGSPIRVCPEPFPVHLLYKRLYLADDTAVLALLHDNNLVTNYNNSTE